MFELRMAIVETRHCAKTWDNAKTQLQAAGWVGAYATRERCCWKSFYCMKNIANKSRIHSPKVGAECAGLVPALQRLNLPGRLLMGRCPATWLIPPPCIGCCRQTQQS